MKDIAQCRTPMKTVPPVGALVVVVVGSETHVSEHDSNPKSAQGVV